MQPQVVAPFEVGGEAAPQVIRAEGEHRIDLKFVERFAIGTARRGEVGRRCRLDR
jgi:hypothetical protein